MGRISLGLRLSKRATFSADPSVNHFYIPAISRDHQSSDGSDLTPFKMDFMFPPLAGYAGKQLS